MRFDLFLLFPAVVVVFGLIGIRFFPERLRARFSDAVECKIPADVVIQRVVAYGNAVPGWRVEQWDAETVQIRASPTLWSWCKRLDVFVRPTSAVTCSVTMSSSSPQLYDWGDNRRAVTRLRHILVDATRPA